MAVPSFIFGGDTGLTQEQITQRRRVLEAMLARGAGAPRNIGEGLSAIGNAIAYRMEKNNLAKNQTAADERRNSILSPLLGGGAPSFVDPNASASAVSSDAGSQMAATDPKPATFAGNQQEFIAAMLPAAIEEGKRTGVDPRIIVAQAAHESGWGKSAPGNNYFGIKSHGKSGGNTLATTEVVDGQPVRTRDSFRAYGSPEESVRGYGDFITENPRYKPMREAQGIDAQLEALGASGYATDPNYARSVGSIARGIQLPAAAEVASLDPTAGMGAPAAIEAQTSPAVQAVGNAMANKPPQPPAYSPAVQAVGNAMMPPQQAMPQDQPMPAGMPPQMGAQPAPQQMAQMQPEPMSSPAQSGPSIQQLRQALMSPDLNDSDRAIVGNVLQQKMQEEQATREQAGARRQAEYEAWLKQNDPKYQVDLEKSRLETENLRNPRLSPNDQANIELSREKFNFEKDKFDQEVQKGQWQKLTDGRLYNQTSGEFKDAPPAAPGSVTPKFEDVSGLRKEIHQLPSYKNIAQALPIYRSMAETADRDTKASDLNLVYGLGKIMDPTSVVREGEMVMVQNTSSIPDWLQGAIASVNGGAKMTPETRKAIMREAFGRMQGYQQAYQQDAGMYGGIVQRSGMNPADVIPNFGDFKVWEPKAPDAPPAVAPQAPQMMPQAAPALAQPQSMPMARPRQGTPRNADPMVIPTDIPGVTIRRKGT